jgi:hypothetical protein
MAFDYDEDENFDHIVYFGSQIQSIFKHFSNEVKGE